MAQSENFRRGLPRAIIFVLIPVGFALIVLMMLWSGEDTGGPVSDGELDPAEDALEASPSPMDPEPVVDPDTGKTFVPTRSGPEGRDDATSLDEQPVTE